MTMQDLAVDANPHGIQNQKTGTVVTASVHIFCGIVGAGVLALPRSIAYLGWVAGPLMIIVFYLVSLLTSLLLAQVYEVDGVEHGRYHTAVKSILGYWYAIGVSLAQSANMVLVGITYTISAATAMKSVGQISCDWNDIPAEDCFGKVWQITLMFGAVQLFLSQVPSLEEAWWVSALGVFTSLFYSMIALALGLKYSGAHDGSVGGISTTPAAKAFGVLSSLGSIAFAYNFSVILLEVQDTLRQPPKAYTTMKPATIVAVTGAFAFYFTVAVANYSAFGDAVPSFILDAYPGPKWLQLVGFVCIMIHMVSAYQVFSQPMFDTIESHVKAWHIRRATRRADAENGRGPAAQPALPEPAKPSEDKLGDGSPAAAPGAAPAGKEAQGPTMLHRLSSTASERLQRMSHTASMYRVSTGFANETVPHNEEHVLLPLWQRIITRSLYVCFTTLIACIMPFFGDMAGLVGALTFWPLAVFFPIRCYRKVHQPGGVFSALLHFIEWSLLIIGIAGTVASLRGIITNWSTYKLFD